MIIITWPERRPYLREFGALAKTQADTAFTSFKFAATGARTARTMPYRFSDIINVNDPDAD